MLVLSIKFLAQKNAGVVRVAQGECDASGSRILQRYITFRQFARITKGITQRGGPASEAKVDSREVRDLEYPCAVSHRMCLYSLLQAHRLVPFYGVQGGGLRKQTEMCIQQVAGHLDTHIHKACPASPHCLQMVRHLVSDWRAGGGSPGGDAAPVPAQRGVQPVHAGQDGGRRRARHPRRQPRKRLQVGTLHERGAMEGLVKSQSGTRPSTAWYRHQCDTGQLMRRSCQHMSPFVQLSHAQYSCDRKALFACLALSPAYSEQ